MINVYYTCPFVPAELITACGLTPCRVSPALDTDKRIEGMCSFVGAWLAFLESNTGGDAAIFTTSCDQMRRAFELSTCSRSFLLNVPSMTNARAFDYYLDELRRLGNFLCGISGKMPDWNRIKLVQSDCIKQQTSEAKQFAIAVAGGPVNEPILHAIKALVEAAGGSVTLNATESSLWPAGLDYCTIMKAEEPFKAIARAYFEMPVIWRRSNSGFFEWFVKQCSKTNVKGIILLRHSFCDLWRCSGRELAKQSSLPVLELDLDGRDELSTWAMSRVEAFLERFKR